jgi:signal transduction histidine kinase
MRTAWARLDSSLRARVLIPCALLFALTLAAMVFATVEMMGRDLENAAHRRAELFMHVAADGLTAAMIHSGPTALPDVLTVVNEHRDEIISLSLLRPDGTVISSSDRRMLETLPWQDLPAERRTVVTPVNSGEYAVLRPIENQPACAHCHGAASRINGYLDARFSRRPITEAKELLATKLVAAAIPSFFVLLAISWWLLGREAIDPLQRLVAAMRRAEAGDRSVVADEGRPDELGTASRGFDATLAALRRSNAELERIYGERMVRADRFAAVGEMATGLAHEIKNPLAGLSSALELLAQDLSGSPDRLEVVKEMQHQVERMTRTMEGLLDFARPPRARMRDMDVGAALENVLFLVKQNRTHRAVVVNWDPAPLPLVRGDAGQIEQVFLNICLNACQAMSKTGGTLMVKSFPEGSRVVVEIADTGPGIPIDARPHIFTPFFTTRHDGNGLGLAISARIVVEHGGRIDFACPQTGGTRFSVSLPVAGPKEVSA